MVYPSNCEAWKHFNNVHPHFLAESRNVCLGLCTNRFNPFESFVAPYSCWPVILIVYNLQPGMCMRLEFMFLSLVIPDPNSLGRNIDVCLRPLIDESALMWTINDFPAYKMGCMENNKAFTLTNGGKMSFFDCYHRFLPMNHMYIKNRNDFFVGRVEKDVAPPHISGEKLHDMVSEYGDIVFGFQSDKQKFPGFGLTHNWVEQSIL